MIEWTDELERIAYEATYGFFIPGADGDDLMQEARIGVVRAGNDYRPGMGASFATFAYFCARRQVITALKAAQRVKHRPLNEALRLDAPLAASERGATVADLFASGDLDPAHIASVREELRALLAAVAGLTPLERECIERVSIHGETYEAVGEYKRVDNAIQRARRKLAAVAA